MFRENETRRGSGGHQKLKVSDWKPFEKNSLRGFFSIVLPDGIVLKEFSLHERDGKRWIGMPSKPWTKKDGTTGYQPMVEFEPREAYYEFQKCALAALDSFLKGDEPWTA